MTTRVNNRMIEGTSVNLLDYGTDEQAFVNAAATGSKVIVPSGTYSFSSKAVFTNFSHLHFEGDVLLEFNGTSDYMLDFQTGFMFTGDTVTFDIKGNDTVSGIHSDAVTPVIDMTSCTIKNSTGYCLLSQTAQGHGKLINCNAIDCGRGYHVYGVDELLPATSTLFVLNNTTSGSTGNVGNIYYFEQVNRVEINGGFYTGASTSGPNCYKCKTVLINGGVYYNINRGPTVGKRTEHFVIQGTRSIDCSFAAIAPDLRDDDPGSPDEYPKGYGVVANNVGTRCGYGVRWQGDGGIISDNIFTDCNQANGIIRVNSDTNNAQPILIANNQIWGFNGEVIRAGDDTTLIMRGNVTDSTSNVAFASNGSADSNLEYSKVNIYSSNFVTPTPLDTGMIDAGVTDIRLPANTFGRCKGKEFTFVRGSNVDNITVQISGGAANGSVNGGTVYTWPSSDRICKAVNATDDNDFIVSSY